MKTGNLDAHGMAGIFVLMEGVHVILMTGLETFELKIEGDFIYVGLEEEPPHEETVTDVMAETMVRTASLVWWDTLTLAWLMLLEDKRKKEI